jgi:predicted RNase H-like HicB family nuclease
MALEFNVVIERDREVYYVASVPALPGCHTQARSIDTLMDRICEAIELCLEVSEETTESLDFVGIQRVMELLTPIETHHSTAGDLWQPPTFSTQIL